MKSDSSNNCFVDHCYVNPILGSGDNLDNVIIYISSIPKHGIGKQQHKQFHCQQILNSDITKSINSFIQMIRIRCPNHLS